MSEIVQMFWSDLNYFYFSVFLLIGAGVGRYHSIKSRSYYKVALYMVSIKVKAGVLAVYHSI